MTTLRLKRWALALTALLLAASCGDGNGGGQATPPTEEPTPAPTPCLLDGASTEPKERSTDSSFQPVTDVRWSDQGCPRVVFEFDEDVSDYEIAYAEGPFEECGSGEPVETEGWEAGAFLSVRLHPSSSVDLAREGEPTYTGSRDVSVGGSVLKHLKVVCDFEAEFTWLVGLAAQTPFSVVTFADPPRIVIDINEERS